MNRMVIAMCTLPPSEAEVNSAMTTLSLRLRNLTGTGGLTSQARVLPFASP